MVSLDPPERFFFPKKLVLRKTREFNCVYKAGKRFRGSGFSLIVLENELGHSRIGISVHRQIKGAVKRNRIKRIIRESFRLQQNQYPTNSDIVFAVRPDFDLGSPEEVTGAVASSIGLSSESR